MENDHNLDGFVLGELPDRANDRVRGLDRLRHHLFPPHDLIWAVQYVLGLCHLADVRPCDIADDERWRGVQAAIEIRRPRLAAICRRYSWNVVRYEVLRGLQTGAVE